MIYLLAFKKEHKSVPGFTLVEMLVVLGLFSFIMTLATSVLYSTQAVNVKLQETQAVLDNVSVSVEVMVRDIRYGSDFRCASTVSDPEYLVRNNCSYENIGEGHGGKVIFLKPVDAANKDDRVAYYATTTITVTGTSTVIQKDEIFVGKPRSSYQITADDVKIKTLVFYVVGASSTTFMKDGSNMDIPNTNDYIQPLITVSAKGETVPTKDGATTTPFVIHTSIASRILDN